MNNFFFLLVLIIPTVLIALALRIRQTWLKTTCVAVLTLPAVGSLVLAVLTLAVLPGVIRENSPAFESRIRLIPMDHYRLDVLYGNQVVTIRQERPVLPGILLVRRIYSAPGTDVRVEVLDSDRVRVTSIVDPESTGGTVLSPKRFVYF